MYPSLWTFLLLLSKRRNNFIHFKSLHHSVKSLPYPRISKLNSKCAGLILCYNFLAIHAYQLATSPKLTVSSVFLLSGYQRRPMCSAVNNAAQRGKAHFKCRNSIYPRSNIERANVPDDKVDWNVPFPGYTPVVYTSDSVKKKPVWADDDYTEKNFSAKWNEVDNNVDRRSHEGKYVLTDEGIPLNIRGRTGIKGRGCLGRWGPNHAADPIVTRWKIEGGQIVKVNGRPVAQFIAIQRKDNGEWAIPGGMVDPGEDVTETLMREFGEEALNSLKICEDEKNKVQQVMDEFFHNGKDIYRGYVDDPRNTDNAWMETVARNFHDSKGTGVAKFPLNAGSDAVGVQWMDISQELKLYASHREFIEKTAQHLGAHWD